MPGGLFCRACSPFFAVRFVLPCVLCRFYRVLVVCRALRTNVPCTFSVPCAGSVGSRHYILCRVLLHSKIWAHGIDRFSGSETTRDGFGGEFPTSN
jgi:hypothetical protein